MRSGDRVCWLAPALPTPRALGQKPWTLPRGSGVQNSGGGPTPRGIVLEGAGAGSAGGAGRPLCGPGFLLTCPVWGTRRCASVLWGMRLRDTEGRQGRRCRAAVAPEPPALSADINECRRYPGRLCGHKCENTLGSYHCSCSVGFRLAADGRSCEGEGPRGVPSRGARRAGREVPGKGGSSEGTAARPGAQGPQAGWDAAERGLEARGRRLSTWPWAAADLTCLGGCGWGKGSMSERKGWADGRRPLQQRGVLSELALGPTTTNGRGLFIY